MSLQQENVATRRPARDVPLYRVAAHELLTKHKDKDLSDLVKLYAKTVRKDQALLESLCEFGLSHVKALMGTTNGRTLRAGAPLRKERMRRAKATAKQILKNLLEYKTPLGKVTADCTGAELDKLGGWYRVLSKLAGGKHSHVTLREKGVTEEQALLAIKAA